MNKGRKSSTEASAMDGESSGFALLNPNPSLDHLTPSLTSPLLQSQPSQTCLLLFLIFEKVKKFEKRK